MKATFKASSYDALPEGIYAGVLEEIEVGENDFGDYRKWKFTVETPDGERTVTAMTSGASGPKAKAYQWASTLLGHRPTGEEETLDGLPCQVHLIVNEDGFNRVAALLPAASDAVPPRPRTAGSTLNLDRLDEKVYEPVEVPF